jgi:hypothetical protein
MLPLRIGDEPALADDVAQFVDEVGHLNSPVIPTEAERSEA